MKGLQDIANAVRMSGILRFAYHEGFLKWRAVVNTDMKLLIPYNFGKFLES
jgi:hypothetical protein